MQRWDWGEKGDKADAQWNSPFFSVLSLRKPRADPQNAAWCYGKILLGQNFLQPTLSDSFKKGVFSKFRG